MKLFLALGLVMMLSSNVLATSESHQIGPYAVTFEMNTDSNYKVQTLDPVENSLAIAYPMLVVTDNNTGASITITEYKSQKDSSIELNEENAVLRLALNRGINATSREEMTIDGVNGYVISGMPFAEATSLPQVTLYQASYWLDNKDCSECGPVSVATTNVGITSTYPEDVVRNLLGSLHVVKGGTAAASAAGSQDMPPAN
jgi:hypothetical protein